MFSCSSLVLLLGTVLLPALAAPSKSQKAAKPSFTVDLKRNCFAKDGNCTQLYSGTMHYIRSPSDYWEDRVSKFRAAGLNTVQTYIPWFIHEPYPKKFFFGGRANITRFIQLTQKYGLQLVLRAGPYMDAEVDNGGLPWWLLKEYPNIRPRTSDKQFLAEVESYYSVLLPMLKPHLYVNGGNIISVQVENEYGSFYACDRQYTKWLRDLFRKYLGKDVLLFTVDGNSAGFLKCGTIPEVFPTVDFGPQKSQLDVDKSFEAQQNYSHGGPRVNSEFYPGWMDLWGSGHSTRSTEDVVKTLRYMWNQNASVNIYMFHGGTNFGYMAGAEDNGTPSFTTITTSYDYDAPLTEAGDPTEKYKAIRKAIEKNTGKRNPYPFPSPSNKTEYGEISVERIGSIFDYLDILAAKPLKSTYPVNAEQLDHPFGFTLYHTTINSAENGTILNITGIRDRAYVIKNNVQLLGVFQRPSSGVLNLTKPLKAQDELSILIENQGRICFGSHLNDTKGLVGNVTLDGKVLKKWTIYPIVLERLQHPQVSYGYQVRTRRSVIGRRRAKMDSNGFIPSFYKAEFKPSKITDTFFDPTGWGKGQVLINNQNLGRYWPDKGPQVLINNQNLGRYWPDKGPQVLINNQNLGRYWPDKGPQVLINNQNLGRYWPDKGPQVLINNQNLGRYWPDKGPQVLINNQNLGRYWPDKGPQVLINNQNLGRYWPDKGPQVLINNQNLGRYWPDKGPQVLINNQNLGRYWPDKGPQVLINNQNLGRYWPDKGPQVRLFVPGVYMSNSTRIIMFELEKSNCEGKKCSVSLKSEPKLSK